MTSPLDLQAEFEYRERTITNLPLVALPAVEVAPLDKTRIGLFFSVPNPPGGALDILLGTQAIVSTRQGVANGEGFTVNALQTVGFNFQLWGPMVGERWFGKIRLGTPNLTVVELYYRTKR